MIQIASGDASSTKETRLLTIACRTRNDKNAAADQFDIIDSTTGIPANETANTNVNIGKN